MPETNQLNIAIRRKMIIFLALGGCCLIALAAGLVLRKYAVSLKMPKSNAESQGMQTTVNNMDASLVRLRDQLPLQLTVRTGEQRIYALLDALRTRYRSADIKVDALQETGNELIMPVRLNLNGFTYSAVAQEVSYLQSLRFPFYEITEISLGGGQNAGQVSCAITGALHIFKPPAQAK